MENKYSINKLIEKFGLEGMPEGLGGEFEAFCKKPAQKTLMRRGFLQECCERFAPGEAGEKKLFAALEEIEQNEELLLLSAFLVQDICAARHRLDLDDYRALVPQKGVEHADMYSLIVLLSCIEPSMNRLKERGVPIEAYQNIPFVPAEKQMNQLRETGSGQVKDFPWDMNFYTCSIFRIGRFYFIPFRIDDDLVVYRKGEETAAFYTTTQKVRRDGQFDGVNAQYDPEAFEISFSAQGGIIKGHPVNPAGVIQPQSVSLNESEWQLVLKKGDVLLGTHIPGGPGYDPEHLKANTTEAYSFYKQWFPEIEVKGFGSESWLYDPHLAHVLGGRGNIPAMQRQMYVYPIESGEGMMWGELFGGRVPLSEAPQKTSLQRAAVQYMQNGGKFTACSFFILACDLNKIGTGTYAEGEEYAKVWAQMEIIHPFENREDEE